MMPQRNWFSKLWDKRILIIEVISIFGAICSIIIFFTGNVPVWVLSIGYFIFAIALIFTNIYESHKRRTCETRIEQQQEEVRQLQIKINDLSRKIENFTSLYPGLHQIFHRIRDCTDFILKEEGCEEDYRIEKIKNYTQNILTEIIYLFKNLYGNNFASCVKLCNEETNVQYIKTFSRDVHSEILRNGKDDVIKYRVDKNTDFFTILRAGKKYFYSVDLTNEKHYENERTDWKEYYLCTVVLPIQRVYEIDGETRRDIVGFLCADSKITSACPEQESVALLSCVADTLFIPLSYIRENYSKYYSIKERRDDKE